MNQPGKYIAYLLFGLFIAAALMPSCTGGNGPDDFNHPAEKASLSISFHSSQQTRAANKPRANQGGEIDEDVFARESKIYSLAVLVFKNESGELDGKKFIKREITDIAGANFKDYKELDEIKEIALTTGIRDVYIIANAPDSYLNEGGILDNVTHIASFGQVIEELSEQGMYDHPVPGEPISGDTPIGGEEPDDRYTNLVMSQSFIGLSLDNGAEKHYLGYTGNDGRPDGVTTGIPLLKDGSPIKVELVRLVARVAIQKITFNLPETLTFDTGSPTDIYNQYVDTVFLLNAKAASSYFPEDNALLDPVGSFGHGNIPGYNFLKGKFSNIPAGSTYADYLYKPINFPEYDITENQVPLWFYAFENGDSETSPTAFVIGVKFQYKNGPESELKKKKVYYPLVVNSSGGGTGDNYHTHIKRNNQYGIEVTIKGLGSYVTDYPDPALKSVALPTMNVLSGMAGVMEIEETVGPNLFPWTGDVYKESGDNE